MGIEAARELLIKSYREALSAVSAPVAIARTVEHDHLGFRIDGRDVPSDARLFVLAAGKAAAAMAEAFEGLAGDRIHRGLVVTKEGHAEGFALEKFDVREAAHPVPDARSEAAADVACQFVAETRSSDVLVVLLSGGASALLSAPAPGLEIADLTRVNEWLLASGADIEEINSVRKHLSRIAGGRLAVATNATRIELLAISDVAGDRPDVIASGPFSADPSRFEEALAIVQRPGPGAPVPERVVRYLQAGIAGQHPETPKPGDARLDRVHYRVIASNHQARLAAMDCLTRAGVGVTAASAPLSGEARDAAARAVDHAIRLSGPGPTAWVAGGETTVTLRGSGVGGRNQEFALAAALEIDAQVKRGFEREILVLAAGTDGTDGPTPAAGAWADQGSVRRADERGRSAQHFLEANDSFHFFEAEGGLFTTGPSGTNVMDLVLIWIGASG